jgi:hypothetical protein
MSRGVVYIATGEDFVRESSSSAKQLKKVMPDISVTLISDYDPQSQYFDSVEIIPDPNYDFSDKISNLSNTPYHETLYLDSDIYIHEPIYEVLDSLDRFDMALSLDAHQQPAIPNPDYSAPDIYGEYDPIPEFNTGLLAYRDSESVEDCLNVWTESYDPENHWAGQPSFIPGFHESSVRVCPLPRRYNFIPGVRNCVSGKVKVFHNRLEGGPEPGYKDLPPSQIPDLIKRVNKSREARVTYPYTGELTHFSDLEVLSNDPFHYQLVKSMWRRGPIGSTRMWMEKIQKYLN